MEPPKKRKYPDLEPVSGSCGLVGVARAEQQEEPGSSLQPAKRNRRSYSLEFKVQVLDSYYHDAQTKLNQRKTALKFGVNRRQIQKWLAQEDTLRGSVGAGYTQNHSLGQVPSLGNLGQQLAVSSTSPAQLSQPPYHRPQAVTVVEVTPELGSGGEEPDFVIDEGSDTLKSCTDYISDYNDDNDELDENKPINLCKVNNIKVENQVCIEKNFSIISIYLLNLYLSSCLVVGNDHG